MARDTPPPLIDTSRRRLLAGAAAAATLGWPLVSAAVASAPQVYDDYTDPSWPSQRWLKFRTTQYDLWDPAASVTLRGGPEATLAIDLPAFTASHPNHVKALLLSTRAFEPAGSELLVQVRMRVRTFGTERNPFGLEPGDVRLAAGALVVIDPETGMVFDFFVSNDRIQPLYERLPSARAQLGDYPAFTLLGKTMPTAPGQWHAYEIRYLREADRVEWRVDGRLLAARDRIGAADGESAPIVKLRRPRIGGGLFTLLDDLNNDRRRADDNPKQRGFIPSNWEDRFGQGASIEFGPFRVSA